MARKATPSGGSGRKRAAAKPAGKKASRKSTGAKPARTAKTAKPRRAASSAGRSRRSTSDMSAADALMKLIESPLVADLLAVGATAALAAIAGRSGGTGSKAKAAGKAAAAAVGRRLSTEVEEIRRASKAKSGAAK